MILSVAFIGLSRPNKVNSGKSLAQLQTDYKPDNVLAFFTAISYHFHISFELQLNKIKGKR